MAQRGENRDTRENEEGRKYEETGISFAVGRDR